MEKENERLLELIEKAHDQIELEILLTEGLSLEESAEALELLKN